MTLLFYHPGLGGFALAMETAKVVLGSFLRRIMTVDDAGDVVAHIDLRGRVVAHDDDRQPRLHPVFLLQGCCPFFGVLLELPGKNFSFQNRIRSSVTVLLPTKLGRRAASSKGRVQTYF